MIPVNERLHSALEKEAEADREEAAKVNDEIENPTNNIVTTNDEN